MESIYLENFEGIAGASSMAVPVDKVKRLPSQPCKFVKLFNWNVGDDTAFTAKPTAGAAGLIEDDLQEIYYGFAGNGGGRLCGQLFSGRETEMLPVSNTDQIVVRARPGSEVTVYYAWFS